jgi:hypothetical protein
MCGSLEHISSQQLASDSPTAAIAAPLPSKLRYFISSSGCVLVLLSHAPFMSSIEAGVTPAPEKAKAAA